MKQFHGIVGLLGVPVSKGERPSQRMCLQMFLEGSKEVFSREAGRKSE